MTDEGRNGRGKVRSREEVLRHALRAAQDEGERGARPDHHAQHAGMGVYFVRFRYIQTAVGKKSKVAPIDQSSEVKVEGLRLWSRNARRS